MASKLNANMHNKYTNESRANWDAFDDELQSTLALHPYKLHNLCNAREVHTLIKRKLRAELKASGVDTTDA